MKKILAIILAALMIAACSVTAFAADTTTVTYEVQPTYTVSIPASVTLGDAAVTADITASDVILEDGKQIKVDLTAASNTASGSTFNAKNGDSTVTYTITGDSAIAVGDTVATFTANGSKTLTFSAADKSAATVAGSHTETLMFGISVEEVKVETLLTTITATGKEQASFSTANVATVSFSYSAGGSSAYLANWGWWGYGWTATVTPAEGYTITKCVFYDDANRKATDSEAPFVVETTEEDKTPQVNGNPILEYTSKGIKKIEVYGYAN